jgi:hypothetical protein
MTSYYFNSYKYSEHKDTHTENPVMYQQEIQISSKHTKTDQGHKPLKKTNMALEEQTALGNGLKFALAPKQMSVLDFPVAVKE